MAMDCKYSMLGLSANKAAAATAAGAEPKIRRAAASRNKPASTKQKADGMEPASPLRQNASTRTKGSISTCGRGSHTAPIWSYPGVVESKIRRAIFRCASASP